jgi:hypothetical protein
MQTTSGKAVACAAPFDIESLAALAQTASAIAEVVASQVVHHRLPGSPSIAFNSGFSPANR